MKEVNGHGWVMLIYADAIQRADKSWQTWDYHRREHTRPRVVPAPDPAWRYSRSRSLYLSIWSLYSDLYLLEEELKDAARKPLVRFWYRTPDLTVSDAAWAVMLEERWQYQVREACTIKYDYGVLDDYHTRLDAAWRTIHRLKEATAAAAPELDNGEPSNDLMDVDLDCQQAAVIAPLYLPTTDAMFGRAAKPSSHALYYVTGGTKTVQFEDKKGEMLIELRGTGAQTVFPPSVHQSGEPIRFEKAGVPATVAYDDLHRRVSLIAAGSLLSRHWPSTGSRHNAAMALAGGLLRGGWSIEDAEKFIRAVAVAAGDDEVEDRVRCVTSTQEKLELGKPARGWPYLAEIIEKKVIDKVRRWLRISMPVSAGRDDIPCDLCGAPRGFISGFLVQDGTGRSLQETCPKCGVAVCGGRAWCPIPPDSKYRDRLILPSGSAPLPV